MYVMQTSNFARVPNFSVPTVAKPPLSTENIYWDSSTWHFHRLQSWWLDMLINNFVIEKMSLITSQHNLHWRWHLVTALSVFWLLSHHLCVYKTITFWNFCDVKCQTVDFCCTLKNYPLSWGWNLLNDLEVQETEITTNMKALLSH